MKSFLQKIVDDIDLQAQELTELKDYCYVFPTRRAGVYFKKYLTTRFKDRFLWSPQVFSVVEFMEHLSEQVVLDPITLIFELYRIYQQKEPEVAFDKFFHWGQIILRDFDEADKYLVDAKALFSNLKDYKQLEEDFALPDESFEYLKLFWNVLDKEENTELEQEFIRIWEILGEVYKEFKETLSKNNAAYEGMIQRQILAQLKEGTLQIPFKQIVFGGFNALGKAEEGIIQHLVKNFNAKVYWDTDVYYLNDKKQEAGKFISKYYEKWKDNVQHIWETQTDFITQNKNIHLVGVPLKVGQAKYTGELIQQAIAKDTLEIGETAIVLGDESLLFPVLFAIPKNVEAINITMGYPLKDSPLYKLLEVMVQLYKTGIVTETSLENEEKKHLNGAAKTKKVAFYSKFVLQIINNPFIKAFAKEEVDRYAAYIARNNLLYINAETIRRRLEPSVFQIIFQCTEIFPDLIKRFNDLLVKLFSEIKEANKTEDADLNVKPDEVEAEKVQAIKDSITLEFIYHLLKHLKKLEETLKKYQQNITLDTFWKLFREVIQSVKLPFTGEPLRGIQVMGFLETRTLDFKNLFVLGLNEGILPATKPHQTFIPFNLRKGCGMPTFLDQDAIYAYHFYHLLQRSENVYLFYNTEVGNLGSGEKSRFLLQLEHEIKNHENTQINLQSQLVTASLPAIKKEKEGLKIPKSEAVMQKLERYLKRYVTVDDLKPKAYAPSALSTYIHCPVQFYFKYIAELHELEAVDEDINPIIFGNILHKTIELLYIDLLYNKLAEYELITDKVILQAVQYSNLAAYNIKLLVEDNKKITTEVKVSAENQELIAAKGEAENKQEKAYLDLVDTTKKWLTEHISIELQQKQGAKRATLKEAKKSNDAKKKKIKTLFDEFNIPDFEEITVALLQKAKTRLISHLLRQDLEETKVEASDIAKLLKRPKFIERQLLKAFREEKFNHHKEGKNLLLKKVILRLVKKVLKNDEKDAPFRIIGLEAQEYKTSLDIGDGREVRISGIIDRIDQVEWEVEGIDEPLRVYRILDYKTGNIKIFDTQNAFKITIERYMDKYFDDSSYKAGFQAYLYGYLFWRRAKDKHIPVNISLGIYALKEIHKGIRYLRKGELIQDDFFLAFEAKLKEMLVELYDKDIPFTQSEEEDAYQWSPYKGLVEN